MNNSPFEKIDSAVLASENIAQDLFEDLRENTWIDTGIVRDSYGEGENYAHKLVATVAQDLDLIVEHDAAANTYMTLPGDDRGAPSIIIGSHLDSVQNGGNYDGAAGVAAGLTALAALRSSGFTPKCDITVMGIRAEESVWFSTSYFGSRAALGRLENGILDRLTRHDTGRSLADHIKQSGGDPEVLRAGRPHLNIQNIRAFLEVHIEQGPVLESENLPIGVVTGIRGNFRFPQIEIHGEYQHCGGVPRAYRRDAMVAAAKFISALDEMWDTCDERGLDMAFTVGKLSTDLSQHAMTKVPGYVEFSLDVRSLDPELLKTLEADTRLAVAEIACAKRVRFDLEPMTRASVGIVDPSILQGLSKGADELGIPYRLIGSGAAHDAAAFAVAGVPMGMIFIRNANGSHNPQESMDMSDFLEATRLLTWWLFNSKERYE